MNKPVAWMYEDASGTMKMLGNAQLTEWVTKFGCKEIPLYTHSVKELTDEEIFEEMQIWGRKQFGDDYADPNMEDLKLTIEMHKAILRKAQEK